MISRVANINRRRQVLAAIALLTQCVAPLQASATVPWPMPSGFAAHFDYANGMDMFGVIGGPDLDGDTLDFDPQGLSLNVMAGNDASFTETLSFDASAHSGYFLAGVRVNISGTYSVVGFGIVDSSSQLTVTENPPGSDSFSGALSNSVPFPISSGNGSWLAEIEVDLGNLHLFTDNSFELSIDVAATTEPGGAASITVSDIEFTFLVLPEPHTFLATSLAASVFLVRRWRRDFA